MKRSTERILSTHVGSLARPESLLPILRSMERGQPYERETYTKLVRDAVTDVVRKQVEAGVDLVTDGGHGKGSLSGYIVGRFDGITRKTARAGRGGNQRNAS